MFGVSRKFLMAALLAGLMFWLVPQLDLAVSSWFYCGQTFYLKKFPPFVAIYWLAPKCVYAVGVLAGAAWLYLLLRRRASMCGLACRAYLYLILAILAGPVLVVNTLLKDHMGRPRPSQVKEFGGHKTFQPAFVASQECEKNGSFVCGHAASGFYFIALALVLRGRARKIVFVAAVATGYGIGLVRIAQGAHFLSDVVFSFVFVSLVCRWLHYAMFADSRTPDGSLKIPSCLAKIACARGAIHFV
jgi:lipid A 4'-phosphatase